jgi:hypothetical protein
MTTDPPRAARGGKSNPYLKGALLGLAVAAVPNLWLAREWMRPKTTAAATTKPADSALPTPAAPEVEAKSEVPEPVPKAPEAKPDPEQLLDASMTRVLRRATRWMAWEKAVRMAQVTGADPKTVQEFQEFAESLRKRLLDEDDKEMTRKEERKQTEDWLRAHLPADQMAKWEADLLTQREVDTEALAEQALSSVTHLVSLDEEQKKELHRLAADHAREALEEGEGSFNAGFVVKSSMKSPDLAEDMDLLAGTLTPDELAVWQEATAAGHSMMDRLVDDVGTTLKDLSREPGVMDYFIECLDELASAMKDNSPNPQPPPQ